MSWMIYGKPRRICLIDGETIDELIESAEELLAILEQEKRGEDD